MNLRSLKKPEKLLYFGTPLWHPKLIVNYFLFLDKEKETEETPNASKDPFETAQSTQDGEEKDLVLRSKTICGC